MVTQDKIIRCKTELFSRARVTLHKEKMTSIKNVSMILSVTEAP